MMTMTTDKQRSHRALKLALVLLVVALAGAWVWSQFFRTYHFAVVQPKVLYRDGLRSLTELENACNKAGIRSVVSVVDAQEQQKPPFDGESKFCARTGRKFVSIPITLGGWPTTADVQRFLNGVADPANQPVLVHCAQGVRRTGMLVAAYQLSVLGHSKEQAKGAILRFGHSAKTIRDIERFIEIYDPQQREVLETLPLSKE